MEEKIYFKHPLGVKLCGVIDNPSENKATPIIIFAHGFTSHKNSKSYTKILNNLHEANISTFRIDLFGHGESGGDFSEITITKGKDSILAAIKYLKDKGYSKIGLLGSSFGGISSIMACSETDDLFCLALKSPVSDWLKIAFPKQDGVLKKWKKDGFINYESEDSSPRLKYEIVEDAKNNIAFDVAHKIKIPTLIVHGNKDDVVPYEDSVKLSKLLPNAALHTVNGTNHHYSVSPEHFEEMSQALSDFLISESEKATH